jgi:PPOX class probable F420-dependent enzyme
MRTGLSLVEVGGLLEEPQVGVLATLRADGSALLSPVWHEWLDGGFNVWVGGDDVKVRHLRRDPRATIVVAESRIPLRGVEVRGEARILTEAVRETAVRIASRYIGDRGTDYVGSADGDAIVRLEPGNLRIWDFVDEYAN